MTADHAIALASLALTVLIAVFTAIWGRVQMLSDSVIEAKAQGLARLNAHDRKADTALADARAEALKDTVSAARRELARLFESELSSRDQWIGTLEKQFDDAGDRASTAATKLQGKIGEVDHALGDLDHRVTVIETRLEAST